MKRTGCRFLACILFIAPFVTHANLIEGPYTYTLSGGKAIITKFDQGYSGALTITNKLGGYSVIAIGSRAFSFCRDLSSVTIPSSITSIDDNAFASCSSLTSVTIPNSVTSISYKVWYNCTSLTNISVESANPAFSSVDGVLFDKAQTTLIQYPGGKAGVHTIPDNVTSIGSWAFFRCFGLTCVTIPNSTTTISEHAFASCTSLTNATIPDSITTIDKWAFYSCSSLTKLTIPDSINTLGKGAFYGCSGLTNVTIPNSVATIDDRAFSSCTNLISIAVDSTNPTYTSVDGILFNKMQTTLIQYPNGKSGSYTIPSNITTIGNSAFQYCTSLTSVTIPASVTTIGNEAFKSCTSLTNIIVESANPSYSSVNGVLLNKEQTKLVQYPEGKSGAYTIPDSVTTNNWNFDDW